MCCVWSHDFARNAERVVGTALAGADSARSADVNRNSQIGREERNEWRADLGAR